MKLFSLSLSLSFATVLALTTTQGIAAEPAHHHHEADATTAAPKVQLEKGKKWETDKPLRDGMVSIRDWVQASLPAVHSGKMTSAQYTDLGKKVDAQIQVFIATCKLTPDADLALHDGVLLPLLEGSRLVQDEKADRQAGVIKMVKALKVYGEQFDHPGWKPIKH